MHILLPETDNCPSWISGRERMDRRKYFMINLHERMLPTSAGVEPSTSWSPVRWRIQLSHRGPAKSVAIKLIYINYVFWYRSNVTDPKSNTYTQHNNNAVMHRNGLNPVWFLYQNSFLTWHKLLKDNCVSHVISKNNNSIDTDNVG